MKYIVLLLLLVGCESVPSGTPYERCHEMAHKVGIYRYTYAMSDEEDNYSCVIPMTNEIKEKDGTVSK